MLSKNEGSLDRLIRVVFAVLFFLLAWFWLGGIVQFVLYVLSLIMFVTAATGFCSLYKVFGINTNNGHKLSKVVKAIFIVILLLIITLGTYYSNFFTKKLFLEDFNVMNNYYKQVLFNTGQEKRSESIANYDNLVLEYAKFSKKYSSYHPRVIAGDKNFNEDLNKVSVTISSLKDGIYYGDLKESHVGLEEVRPVFQDILKRNGFSMLAVYLVDFHDSMEKVIFEADGKNPAGVIESYNDASNKMTTIEEVANDDEIKAIRNNLEALLQLAEEGNAESLPAKAAELKSSFIKVYLKRG